MIRKTLTILTLIGLLFSVGLWGVSYFDMSYTWVSVDTEVAHERTVWSLGFGGFESYQSTAQAYLSRRFGTGFRVEGFDGFATGWVPSLSVFVWSRYMFIPFWIPTLLFAALFLFCRPFHFHRRRKRKKLGLCVKCGYDLRASKERCPECGETT